jgi:lauroyl/myristoyl acyltransferase
MRAHENLANAPFITNRQIPDIIKEYLRFESRFVIESAWLRRHKNKYTHQAFCLHDLAKLKQALAKGPHIIVTAHTGNIYLNCDIVNQLRPGTPIVSMDMTSLNAKHATPLQKRAVKAFSVWKQRQTHITLNSGQVMPRCRKLLETGQSLMIAPDTHYSGKHAMSTSFAGFDDFKVGPGAAVLSQEFNLPMLIVIPWAAHSDAPYKIKLKTIAPELSVKEKMEDYFSTLEQIIQQNPACWSGWLYY